MQVPEAPQPLNVEALGWKYYINDSSDNYEELYDLEKPHFLPFPTVQYWGSLFGIRIITDKSYDWEAENFEIQAYDSNHQRDTDLDIPAEQINVSISGGVSVIEIEIPEGKNGWYNNEELHVYYDEQLLFKFCTYNTED